MDFDVKLELRKELRHLLPFPYILSRLPTALILQFYGLRSEVCQILQVLSHTSRAYIVNEDGLKGFIKPFNLNLWLCKQNSENKLEQILGQQNLNFTHLQN